MRRRGGLDVEVEKVTELETGKITLSGDAKDLINDESVKKAYLGE